MNTQDERDKNGNLTDVALATATLNDYGCDCGTDELGTCLTCICKAALKHEHERIEFLEGLLKKIFAVGHFEDCLFCGFKDRIAMEVNNNFDKIKDTNKETEVINVDSSLMGQAVFAIRSGEYRQYCDADEPDPTARFAVCLIETPLPPIPHSPKSLGKALIMAFKSHNNQWGWIAIEKDTKQLICEDMVFEFKLKSNKWYWLKVSYEK